MTDDPGITHDNGDDPTGELEPVTVAEDASASDDTIGEAGERSTAQKLEANLRRPGSLAALVTQGLAGAAIVFLLAADPYAFTSLEQMAGLAFVAFGLFEAVSVTRKRGPFKRYLQPAAVLIAGVVLLLWPGRTLTVAGIVAAALLLFRGSLDVWAGLRRWYDDGSNSWVFVRGLILLALAAISFLFPKTAISFAIVGMSAFAVARALIGVWWATSTRGSLGSADPTDTFAIVTYWLSSQEMDAAEASEVDSRVFLHIGSLSTRAWRFAILMLLATTIATFGIATDSTAVVIGAMLVAPLMTPILGISAGLINGKTRSTLISATVTGLGVGGAVFFAWALAATIPDLQTVMGNSQVLSRTQPSLLDLVIAIAAGAAGAYGVSRADSSDALPGVAVAIALVPPLAVTGIALHAGEFGRAQGSFLLFLTNFFSILLMAGLVFIIVGYGSWSRLYHRRNRIRVSFAAVVLGVIVISIPLGLTAKDVLNDASQLRAANALVFEWLGEDTNLRVTDVSIDDEVVQVQLVGPDRPPLAVGLARLISDEANRDVTVSVRWVPEREELGRADR